MNDLTAYERSGIEITAEDSGKNDEKVYEICEDGATMHRLCFRERENVNPEQGGVLEVENGAQNVTGLDGFVSLGKSSMTKKEFQFMCDENNSNARSEYLARAQE